MEQSGPGDEGTAKGVSAEAEVAALQRRVDYLEWLTREMASDLMVLRERAPNLFHSRSSTSSPVISAPAGDSHPQDAASAEAASPDLFAKIKPPRTKSLEADFGSRVLSKIAIVLLLFGVAWFLKWAFDNRWIGPSGRVVVGLAAGIAVVLWSERFRKKGMAAFSYGLKAVGSGTLYLSLWAAFQLYHLVPSAIALLAMIAVTAWNVFMAWSQDAELLAAYALFGAYLTPILLSTGGNHEVFLFNYLLVVAVAVLALLRTKPWSRLLFGSLPATTAFFIAWYSEHFKPDAALLTLSYALLLWAVFAAAPFVSCEEGPIVSILAPQGAAVFGALTVYSVLADSGRKAQEPWWALAFATVYLAFTKVRTRGIASAIHLALAIVFLTIAVPLKATGHGITAGWLSESVALLWIATLPSVEVSSRSVMRWLAYIALALGVGGALLGPLAIGASGHPFVNRNFATSLGAITALALAMALQSRVQKGTKPYHHAFLVIALISIHIVLLTAMYREINAAVFHGITGNAWQAASERNDFLFSGWMMLQGAASLAVGFVKRNALSRWIGLMLLGATVLKTFLYDMRNLGTGYRVVSYLGLGIVLMAVSFAYQKDWLGLREATESPAAASIDEVPL